IISLLVSAIIIGFSFVVLKTGLQYASPYAVLFDRLLMAALVIYILKKIKIVKIDKITNSYKFKLFFLSLLYPIAFFLFQNLGIIYITASEASIIYSLIPILTTIASAILLKEKATGLQKIGVLLSFSGMVYISVHSFSGFSDSAKGYIILFCSLLSIVFYYIFLKKFVNKISAISITYYLILFALLPSFALYLSAAALSDQYLLNWQRLLNFNYLLTI